MLLSIVKLFNGCIECLQQSMVSIEKRLSEPKVGKCRSEQSGHKGGKNKTRIHAYKETAGRELRSKETKQHL